jgi:hypothetical protein
MRPQEPTSPHLVSFGGVRPLALTKRQACFRARFIKTRGAHALGKPSRRRSMAHHRKVGPRSPHRHFIA